MSAIFISIFYYWPILTVLIVFSTYQSTNHTASLPLICLQTKVQLQKKTCNLYIQLYYLSHLNSTFLRNTPKTASIITSVQYFLFNVYKPLLTFQNISSIYQPHISFTIPFIYISIRALQYFIRNFT